MILDRLKKDLRTAARKEKADGLSRFFKTGKGDYGEGDLFLGVMVPESRAIAKKNLTISLADIKKLLGSPIHEERFVALIILVHQYQHGDAHTRENIFEFYVKNLRRVNNWDLIDVSAPKILGAHLFQQKFSDAKKMRALLGKLSSSKNLWERRASVLATFYFIAENDFAPSLDMAKRLMNDEHDLIHKAVGWMLREVGKRDVKTLENFLKESGRYKTMPRTMLRYAIERFPEQKRKKYLMSVI